MFPEDFDVHVCTPHCPGCTALRPGAATKRNHSEACRKRIEKLLLESPGGQARKQREHDRVAREFENRVRREYEEVLRRDGAATSDAAPDDARNQGEADEDDIASLFGEISEAEAEEDDGARNPRWPRTAAPDEPEAKHRHVDPAEH